MSEKKEIKISEILELLGTGVERPAIKEKYGLSHAEMKALFSHPKLKAKKTKKPLAFDIVDDVPETPKRKSTDSVNRKKNPVEIQDDTATTQTAEVTNTPAQQVQAPQTPVVEAPAQVQQPTQPQPTQPQAAQPVAEGIKEVQTEEDKQEEAGPTTGTGLW